MTGPSCLPSSTATLPKGLRDQFVATVAANVPLCREHYRLVLRVPSFPPTEPGQFIQVGCRDVEGDDAGRPAFEERELEWSPGRPPQFTGTDLAHPTAVLRRPFSLAGRRDTPAGVELDVIHRVVGVGTDWMSRLRVGDPVGILGPLGNRFELPGPDGLALLVGGGVGIPPMIYLAERLAGRKAIVFSGALTRDLLPLTIAKDAPSPASSDAVEPLANIAEFARHGIPAVITTDDGTYGFRGFVTQALERWLDRGGFRVQGSVAEGAEARRHEGTKANPQSPTSPVTHLSSLITIYTCGPEPMMKRVAEIAASRGLACQVAVERAMACGMGTCQSCCIRVRKPDPAKPPLPGSDWCYRLACTDGPVFLGADLLW